MDLPSEKEAIGLKWVFKTKYNEDGSVQKHKARLVARAILNSLVWILLKLLHRS